MKNPLDSMWNLHRSTLRPCPPNDCINSRCIVLRIMLIDKYEGLSEKRMDEIVTPLVA